MSSSNPNRRPLAFATEDGVIAEVNRLRKGGYVQHGNWSLPQIAWHLVIPLEKFLNPPADPDAKPTAEQQKMKAGFVDYIVANNELPPHATTAPPSWTPPASANEADIDRFIAGLHKLKAYPHTLVEMGPVGPVPIAECRRVNIVHASHHLSYLEPRLKRRETLRFKSHEDVIADISKLRQGYEQRGDWTLPQICWHLNLAMTNFTRAGQHPDAPAASAQQRNVLERILAAGMLPIGNRAPEQAVPSAQCCDADIDAFIATLERLKSFTGPYAPHPFFGKITDDEARRISLIHCSHHLSHLVPVGV